MFKRLAKLSASVALAAALSSAAFAEVCAPPRQRQRAADTRPGPHLDRRRGEHPEGPLRGLTVYDAGGNIIPGAAESWTVSDDGLVYTFKIREAAKWSNGDPVTADDSSSLSGASRIRRKRRVTQHPLPDQNAEAINTAKPEAPVAIDTLA